MATAPTPTTISPEPITEGIELLHDLERTPNSARDLADAELAKIRRVFEDRGGLGLYMFAYAICGCGDLDPPLHLDVCRFLSKWGTPEAKRLMLVMPRGTFKTSVGTRANALWTATLNPEATIGIFNEAESNVKKWIGAIKQVVEQSQLYQALWPDLLSPGVHYLDIESGVSVPRSWKWGDTGLMFRRESLGVAELTFEPFGIGGSRTGKHFTHIILDDIVGEKSGESPAIMEDAIHFIDHARALERPVANGNQLICCTRWGYYDVYAHILKRWPDEYQIYHRSLLENPTTREPDIVTGESIAPTLISTGEAYRMRDGATNIGSVDFHSQFMNQPKAGKETSFRPEWLRYTNPTWRGDDEPFIVIEPTSYDPALMHADLQGIPSTPPANIIPLSWLHKAVLLDPAPTKKGERTSEPRARNGIVVCGVDPWGRRHVLESLPLREDPVSVLNAILELCDRWRTDTIAIEEVNFSAVYAPLWSEILRSRRPNDRLNFVPLKTGGRDKDTRIRRLMGPHAEGLIYYNRADTKHVIQELLEYPYGETRDLVDALAYIDDVLSRPMTPDETYLYNRRSSPEETGRDKLTGY